MRKAKLNLVLLACLAATSPAQSAITYTDQGAFRAANPGTSLTQFVAPPSQTTFPSPLTIGPLQFTGNNFLVAPRAGGNPEIIVFARYNPGLNGAAFDLSFTPATAIGFHLFGFFNETGTLDFKRGGTTVHSVTTATAYAFRVIPGTNDAFPLIYFGIAGIGVFDNIRFTPGLPIGRFGMDASGMGIANVSLLPAVPEPTSWALLIAGFGLVGAAQRRRRAVPG